jgi:transposase-like protein
MKTKVKHYTDEFKLTVVQEYLTTSQSAKDILRKYHLGGNNNIANWMRKFGLEPLSDQQIALQHTMAKQVEKTRYEQELEAKVEKLQHELEHEQLRTLALNTLIDVAERDLKISIRKKAGAKR